MGLDVIMSAQKGAYRLIIYYFSHREKATSVDHDMLLIMHVEQISHYLTMDIC